MNSGSGPNTAQGSQDRQVKSGAAYKARGRRNNTTWNNEKEQRGNDCLLNYYVYLHQSFTDLLLNWCEIIK